MCSKILADPESNTSELQTLNNLLKDASDGYVARLVVLSCVAVYRDLLPGYRIRLPTDKELEVKVSFQGYAF